MAVTTKEVEGSDCVCGFEIGFSCENWYPEGNISTWSEKQRQLVLLSLTVSCTSLLESSYQETKR